MNEPRPLPDWAPENCPPSVVRMIEDHQFSHDMGIVRGLISGDSKELQAAVRRLKWQLAQAAHRGYRRGNLIGVLLGAVAGAVIGAAATYVALAA